jgi:ATP-dependent helicase/nuclease subunit B
MKGSGAGFETESCGVVLKCPIHSPFIPSLAAAVLHGSIWNGDKPRQHELSELTIYLPSRAPAETLKLAFLAQSPNGATFLPRIRVLGEADPLDLFSAYAPRMASTALALELLERALAVPAAFDELERQVQLAALVSQASRTLRHGIDEPFMSIPAASAFTVAGEIAALIGEAHTECADLTRVAMLDGAHAPGSEQLSLQLLRSVLRGWQAQKLRAGKLDRDERRNRLMAVEAEFIRHSDAPVIIAGSTGSVAATVGLMEAALSRPHSALVLYGLDDSSPEASALAGPHPEHPQHGLHQLLARLDTGLEDIAAIPGLRPPHPSPLPRGAIGQAAAAAKASLLSSREKDRTRGDSEDHSRRAEFLSKALRPAPATADWAPFIECLKQDGGNPAPGLSMIEADTIQDEAAAVALILRESLETEGQTAALVTPSESLLNRVRHELAQWGLDSETAATQCAGDDFAARVVSCAASGKPGDFVELLRQAEPSGGVQIRRAAEILDLGILRQMWRPGSLADIPAALSRAEHAISSGEARHPAVKRIAEAEWEAARRLAGRVIEALSPLALAAGKRLALPDWIAAHRQVLTGLAGSGLCRIGGKDQAESTLDALERAGAATLNLDLPDYAGFFAQAASARRRDFTANPHPRLSLCKPLDARLLSADTVVLGGLNEGCWPQTPGPDPWLSRSDRDFVGLPPPERRIGQTAHDFQSLACSAPRVILTRSKKVNGTLARPSRWISRIKALAAGAGKLEALKPGRPWLSWAAHRMPASIAPIARPEPRPPLAARPRRLSVTAIETWFANPYAIYARHILGLEPLRRLDETSDARDKGILYHAALHGFFQAYPGELPANAADKLVRQLDKAAEELGFYLENAPFWRPRFARFAAWFAETENARRVGVDLLKSEVGGKLRLDVPAGRFEITARADRIDRLSDGALRIYDFKTSANNAKVSAARGAPQLALEGLLAKEGAFAGVPAGSEAQLFYIVASGGEPPGEIVEPKDPSAEAIQAAYSGVVQRIARFDNEATPYAYEARAIFREKAENDPYAHLARVLEWSAEADDGEGGDD